MKNKDDREAHEGKGIILAILSSLCLGIVGIIDKLGTIVSKNPFIYSTETIFFALCFTVCYFFFFDKKLPTNSVKQLSAISWMQISIIGCFTSGIVILLRFIGLSQSTGTFATLSQVITTLLTVILARFFLKEKLSKGFWLLFLLIIVAMYFVSVGSFSLATIKKGDAFILFGTLFLAISNIITKFAVQKVSPIMVSVGMFFFGFLFLFLINILFLSHSTFSFPLFSVLSGLLWCGSTILFNLAIKKIGATLTTALLMLAPVATMILETTLLSPKFTLLQYSAALIVAIGGIIIALRHK